MKKAMLLCLLLPAAGPAPMAAELGQIEFPSSGKPRARESFLEGVLWLHSFEYDAASQSFRKAQELDPGFALAYWGEAMTHNHPVWNLQDREAALAALARLAPTSQARLAKARTRRERGYLAAIETLYGPGSKESRDAAYAESMRGLAEENPQDLEAASFHALALLGTCQGVRDIPAYMRAAAVAEEVLQKNPRHPGALHYLIHSYDDPVHAPLGMRAARLYSKVAPAAPHALHMPSHIFVPLGMWDAAAAANEASLKAAEGKNLHALHWLEYVYLQQGRYKEARELLAAMERDAAVRGFPRARWILAAMRAAYLVETRRWKSDAAAIRPDMAGVDMPMAAADSFTTGWSALEAGDRRAAEAALAEIKRRRSPAAGSGASQERAKVSEEACHAPETTPMQVQTARIMESELEALLLFARGKRGRALERMEEAQSAQEDMSYEFGPPLPVKPPRELLGEMLLEAGSFAQARGHFKLALAKTPGRARSLLGLARAARGEGDAAEARAAYAELHRVWRKADADLPELREIETALSSRPP